MKKLAALCIIGLALGTVGVFAEHPDGWGLGIVGWGGGGSNGGGGGGALSLKAPPLPIYWGIYLGNLEGFGMNVTGDYYLFDKALVPDINLDWYFGVGGYVGLSAGFLAVGARAPLGLSWEFLEHFELFGNLYANLGIRIVPAFDFPHFGIGGELGIRYWF